MASSTEPDTKRPLPVDDDHAQQDGDRRRKSNSSNPPQPKRRRVAENARVRSAKACQRCRRLKEKCDGQQPCQRCLRSGRACEFAPAGMGASSSSSANNNSSSCISVKTEGLSSSAAAAAAVGRMPRGGFGTADSVRLEERTKCLERLVQHLLGDVPMDLNNLRRMAEKAGQRGGDDGGARAGLEDSDDLTLEDENFTVKTLSQSTAHYSGEFSHWNFSQKLRRRLSQCLDSSSSSSSANVPSPRKDLRACSTMPPPPPSATRSRPGMRIMEYWRATQLQSPKTLVQGVLSCLPPRAVSHFLVQIYFQFAQVNNFYVEEAWLRKKLEFLYAAPGHVTSEDSAWVCSVLMVLGIGTQFAHMAAGPPPTDDAAERDKVSSSVAAALFPDSDSDIGVGFYQTASKLIPDIITIASMESVRAFLLLAHYVLPLDTQGLAYTYLGLGMKMAIQNGMHRRYTGTDLDAWTIETRNRLWWTAYTVERRVSVLHGRPASIAATEVDADLPKDMPEFKQHGDVSNFSNMSALIEMTLRLGDVANAITLLRRCPKNLQHTYFERIVDICESLRDWWSSLPPQTRDPAPSTQTFRSNAHLKLSLLLNDIFVGRPFIFSHNNTTTTPTGTSPGSVSSSSTTTTTSSSSYQNHPPTSSTRPHNRLALAHRAVTAAMSAIALLRTLHETTGLARSSYTEFSSCRAALLVMLAASVDSVSHHHPSAELKASIDVGMQLIRRMAAGNVSTQSETSVIEALETAVRRLHERGGDGREVGQGGRRGRGRGCDDVEARDKGESGSGGEEDAGKSGYERFREWASLWPGDGAGATAMESRRGGACPTREQEVAAGSTSATTTCASSGLFSSAAMVPASFAAAAAEDARRTPPSYGMPPAGLPATRTSAEWSSDSARWLTMVGGGVGVGMGGIEQLDDLGLFGGFPELGALDGWPGL